MSDLARVLRSELQCTKKDGTSVYLKAAIARPSLVKDLNSMRCRVLLVGGEQSLYRDELWKATLALRKDRFAYLTVDSTGMLVTAEAPQ